MCGIVGYVGARPAQDVIIQGLKRLEYRGYDSAGLAVIGAGNKVEIRRDAGKLHNLEALLAQSPVAGHIGIGHTRWATHGKPVSRNAHPHLSMNGRVVVVHNGIVENFAQLKEELSAEGISFVSDTDTEVIAQIAERYLESGLSFVDAARKTLGQLRGSNAIVLMDSSAPDRLVCARLGNAGGITIGVGQEEMFVASDIPAILEYTRDMIFLENRQIAVLQRDSVQISDIDGRPVEHETVTIPWDPISAVKGEYKHFMQKEIFEQPRALIDTLRGRLDLESPEVTLSTMNLTDDLLAGIERIYIVACGTSFYAAQVGKMFIEKIARIPTEVAYGSEFRYEDPIVGPETAVLAISQSGETADTLAAAELAKSRGATLWSIVNVFGSQLMRMSDGYIAMQAGPEIGVASTKAFTNAIADQLLLALKLGQMRETVAAAELNEFRHHLALLPDAAGRVLDRDLDYEALAADYFKAENFLYLGRGLNYPIAMEGALKLKELSYIHAEGYPAGEMKHGPIALIDESMPILAIITRDNLYDKMLSQIQQARSRGGRVIALATEGDELIGNEVDDVIFVPEVHPFLSPIINVIPLQLFSYHVAVRRGCDVDQPRNLAKSVTVE